MGPHPPFLLAEGLGCTAYDIAVNSDFYRRMQVGGVAAGEARAGASLPLSLEPSRIPARPLSPRTANSCESS